MPDIDLTEAGDFEQLGQRWRALEASSDGGFFRSWDFLGCQVAERFAGARLLAVTEDGADVALALLGRAGGALWLNQTGNSALDAPFLEYNGLLVRSGHEAVVAAALRRIARVAPLVLAGVDDATLAAARAAGWVGEVQTRPAPFVDLAALTGPYLATLSANTRGQINRSQRLYGPGLALSRARDVAEALDFFSTLVALHQAAWVARGKPGAFADTAMLGFHQALIRASWPRGTVDLLMVRAADRVIGVLYQFVCAGRVLSYQSGFAYSSDAREKPGLVCHALAIAHYADQGMLVYDFLAGGDRYKRSLAGGEVMLHWTKLYRPWSPAFVWDRLRRG